MTNAWSYDTKTGSITICVTGGAVSAITFGNKMTNGAMQKETPLHQEAFAQLCEYLDGKRSEFTLPLSPEGTAFQRAVWNALIEIPYGQCLTYGQIAQKIGKPKAARAVGMACNRNPISIVVPCHRVVGATGSLTGYAGGLDRKRALLTLEGCPCVKPGFQTPGEV